MDVNVERMELYGAVVKLGVDGVNKYGQYHSDVCTERLFLINTFQYVVKLVYMEK